MNFEQIAIKGKIIDSNTRCVHYNSEFDIIAIKFKCCNIYYPCYKCHEEEADHGIQKWKKHEDASKAVFCGNCHNEITIEQYINSNNKCPFCKSSFNPTCKEHYHFYFDFS